MRKLVYIAGALTLLAPTAAQAYIGPGVGAGAIAVVLGVFAALIMAFLAVLWYPVKRLIRAFTSGNSEGKPLAEAGPQKADGKGS